MVHDTYPDQSVLFQDRRVSLPGRDTITVSLLLMILSVDDADELPVLRTLALELHKSVFLGEKCVIAAKAYVPAGVNTCATLPNDDISGNNCLAAEDFDAVS